MFPWGWTKDEKPENEKWLADLGSSMAAAIHQNTASFTIGGKSFFPDAKYESYAASKMYPVGGGMDDWFWFQTDCNTAYTMELRPAAKGIVGQIWTKIKGKVKYSQTIDPYDMVYGLFWVKPDEIVKTGQDVMAAMSVFLTRLA